MFLLILVQDADRDASVTLPEVGMCCLWRLCCKWSDAGFVLKLDVEMLLLVDSWEVVIGISPNSNFHQLRLSVYISSAVSRYRNLHQGFMGFPCLIYLWSGLPMLKSCWPCGGVLEQVPFDHSQQLHSSFKPLIISFTFSSFMFWVRTQNDLPSFQKFKLNFSCTFLGLEQDFDKRSEVHRSRCEKEQGDQALSLGFTALWSLFKLNGWLHLTCLCL